MRTWLSWTFSFRPSGRGARIIGPKPQFKPRRIRGIRQQLKANGRVRDLAMFNCAKDAKLRGCDLVKLRVSDVALGGSLRARATIIQQKTGQPVPFEITGPTRDALAVWLNALTAQRRLAVSPAAADQAVTSARGSTPNGSTSGCR